MKKCKSRGIFGPLLLLSLSLLPSQCEKNEQRTMPCPPNLSIVIPHYDSQILADGNLVYEDLTFPKGNYWRDGNITRGCMCLGTSKPCLRKCCPPGHVIAVNPTKVNQCEQDDGSGGKLNLMVDRTSPDMQMQSDSRPTLNDWFTVFTSPQCADEHISIKLLPNDYPEDAYVLYPNGSLWLASQEFLPIGRFCIDRQMGTSELAVLACMPKDSSSHEQPLIGVKVGCLLSVPFLAVTFLVYAIIPELRNIYGKTLMCYVVSLLTAYLSVYISHFFDFGIKCVITAYIVHFSFLASFFWLNVMCFDIWWTFGGFRSLHGSVKQRERKKFIMYSIYAWGCASILTIICMIMDLVPGIPMEIIRPEFGKGSCWFESDTARAIYFYGPMGATVLCNICLFILTALKILRHKKDTARQLKGSESRRHDDNKQWFNLYLKLFIVMGINWSMEIISWLCEGKLPSYVWYITDLTNTLQGVIIFAIFVWKDKIKRLLMKRFGCQGTNFLSRNSTSRSGCPTTSSTSRMTCVTALQEKTNPYADSYRGKSNLTNDESDCI